MTKFTAVLCSLCLKWKGSLKFIQWTKLVVTGGKVYVIIIDVLGKQIRKGLRQGGGSPPWYSTL
jgi:hypothetical protein